VYWLIEGALNTDRDDYRGYYFGQTQKSAKQVTWHYFKKLLAPLSEHGYVTFRETELQAVFSTGAIITLAGSESIENYRGIYIDRIVCDELASWQNANYAYFEVLRPAMADREAHSLFIGTVKGLDLLYDFYMRGISTDPMDVLYDGLKLKASTTGILPEAELEDLRRSMSPEAYAREMECDFFAESPDMLISPSEVQAALDTERILSPQQRSLCQKTAPVFGLDPGRNVDPSVLCVRRHLTMEILFESHTPDHMELAQRVSRLIRLHRPTSVFIDAGQGQGVIDRLIQLGHGHLVVEVPFGGESPEPSCVNARDAMYYRLKKFLKKGTIPNNPRLIKELTNVLLIDDKNNRIKLAPKKEIKKLIQRSPNLGDACALTLFDEDPDSYPDEQQQTRDLLTQLSSITGIPLDTLGGQPSYDPLGYMEKYDE
jgi:hypothetical protein